MFNKANYMQYEIQHTKTLKLFNVAHLNLPSPKDPWMMQNYFENDPCPYEE